MELAASLHPPTEVHVVLEYHSPRCSNSGGGTDDCSLSCNSSGCGNNGHGQLLCDSPLSSAPNSPDSPGRKRILDDTSSDEEDEDNVNHPPNYRYLQMPTLLSMNPSIMTKQNSTLGRESRKSRLLRARRMQHARMSSSSFASNPQQDEEIPLDEKKSHFEEGGVAGESNPEKDKKVIAVVEKTNEPDRNQQPIQRWIHPDYDEDHDDDDAEIPLISTLHNNRQQPIQKTMPQAQSSQEEIEHDLERIVLPFDEVVTITNDNEEDHHHHRFPNPKDEASPDDERDELLQEYEKRTQVSTALSKNCHRDATASGTLEQPPRRRQPSYTPEWMDDDDDLAGPEDELQLHKNIVSNNNPEKQPPNEEEQEPFVFQPDLHVGTSREEDIEVSLVSVVDAVAPSSSSCSYEEAITPSFDQEPPRLKISFRERSVKTITTTTSWKATFDEKEDVVDDDLHAVPTDEQLSNLGQEQQQQQDPQSLFQSFSFPPAVHASRKLQSSILLDNSTILHVSSSREEEEEMPLDELILDRWNRRSSTNNKENNDEGTCPLLNVTEKEPVAKMLDLTETSASFEGDTAATLEDEEDKEKTAIVINEKVRNSTLPLEPRTMLMDPSESNLPSLSLELNCLPQAFEQHKPLLEEGFPSSDGTPFSNQERVVRICRPSHFQHRRDRLYNEKSLPEYWKKQSLKSRKLLQRSMHKSKRMAATMMKSRDRSLIAERALSDSLLSESFDHYHLKSIGVKTIATVCNGVGSLFHGETLPEQSKRRKEAYVKLSPDDSPTNRSRQCSKSSSLSSPIIPESKTDSEISSDSMDRRFSVPRRSHNVDVDTEHSDEATPMYFAEALERSIEAEDGQQDTPPHQWKSTSANSEACCSSTASSFPFDDTHNESSQTNKYSLWLEIVKNEVSKLKNEQSENDYVPSKAGSSRSMSIKPKPSDALKLGGSESTTFSGWSLVNDLRRRSTNMYKQATSSSTEELGTSVFSSISEDGSEDMRLLSVTPRHKKRTEQTDLRSCRTEKTAALTPLSEPPTLRHIGDGRQVEWSTFNPILLRKRLASNQDRFPYLKDTEESLAIKRAPVAPYPMSDFLYSRLQFSESNNSSLVADSLGAKSDKRSTLSPNTPPTPKIHSVTSTNHIRSTTAISSPTVKNTSNPSFDASVVHDKCDGNDKSDSFFPNTKDTSDASSGIVGSTTVDPNPSFEISLKSNFSSPMPESPLRKTHYMTHPIFDNVEKSDYGCGLPDFQASRIQDASNPSFDAFNKSHQFKCVAASPKSKDLSCNGLTTEELLDSLDDMVKDLDNLTSDDRLERALPSSSIPHGSPSSFGSTKKKICTVATDEYSDGDSESLGLSDVPVLISSINNDIGIPKGDVMLSLLNNESMASSVDEAIWRCRTMRRQCDTRWLEYNARRVTKGAGTRKQGSLCIDVDDVRVQGASVLEIEKAAIEHIRHDDFDDALTLYEEILLAYKKAVEESHSECEHQKYKEHIGVAHHNLGIVNLLLGEHQVACFHFESATAERAQCLGAGHPDHLVS